MMAPLLAFDGDALSLAAGAAGGGGDQAQLTAVFLRLTGGGALQEIDEIV